MTQTRNVPSKLVAASRIMAWIALSGAAITPIVTALVFLFPDSTRALNMQIDHLGARLTNAIPLADRLAALVFEMIPAAMAVWALVALARLFRSFAVGDIFSSMPLHHLTQVTTALFLNVLTAFVMQAPISYFLTRHAPPGHREISLSLGSDDIQMLFLAGVAFVIARVMAEARRIAEENASFV